MHSVSVKGLPGLRGKVRRPAVALQTEKRRGGCAYESLEERKTKVAAQRSNTQFEGYVPAAWNSGFSGPDGACCLPALGRLGKPQAGR